MTNFELNKKLAELVDIGKGKYIVKFNEHEGAVYLCEKGGFFDLIPIGNFDPCTNWNDIMPIAIELGVSLLPVFDCNGQRSYSVGVANFNKGSWDVESGEPVFLFEDYHDKDPKIALVKCCIGILESKLRDK